MYQHSYTLVALLGLDHEFSNDGGVTGLPDRSFARRQAPGDQGRPCCELLLVILYLLWRLRCLQVLNLGGHDEIIVVQTVDLMCPKGDRGFAVGEANIGMMILLFR